MILQTAILLTLLPFILCCKPQQRRESSNATTQYPFADLGLDTPSSPATIGFFINHFSLNTNNLTRSLNFYTPVFGLRHMFTYHLTPCLSITQSTHSQGGRNGSAYQTTAELIRNKQNSAGIIELVYFNRTTIGGAPIQGGHEKTGISNHVGFVTPDQEATQKRLEEHGVRIYKKLGGRCLERDPWDRSLCWGMRRGWVSQRGVRSNVR
ncbi:hypothetical protein BU23DRAFT_306020 [Bimuria novae-zelandiae CBS 107.79]|uniref:Glyoxalase/fosfomycin resistance/dioxygenase domain-containing protein n=1 Tax=Bimuria novae-zelandiae CBS 107.79 TaxID=1447943 RepID=A0A6A5UVG0_9PLEO|nr:hypothetical protein BU23DRAFT_306020 [Bimuria novae-zelandiae CBS 107.79]